MHPGRIDHGADRPAPEKEHSKLLSLTPAWYQCSLGAPPLICR